MNVIRASQLLRMLALGGAATFMLAACEPAPESGEQQGLIEQPTEQQQSQASPEDQNSQQ